MARPSRTEGQREADREKIAVLWLRGLSHRTIAEQLGNRVTRRQVSYDLENLRKKWLDSAMEALEEKR